MSVENKPSVEKPPATSAAVQVAVQVAAPTAPKIHLPAKAIAIAGRTGSGKSTLFCDPLQSDPRLAGSKHLSLMMIADTGSMGHMAYMSDKCQFIDPESQESPVEQVKRHVLACTGIWALDSWSTFQEVQIMWSKNQGKLVPGDKSALKAYGEIVMSLRDFVQWLSRRDGIVLFNTATGGKTTNPLTKETEETPAGCITGLSSLSGVKGKEETILRAFSTVYVICQPVPEARDAEGKVLRAKRPRGFIVPGHDFRPAQKLIDGKIVSPSDYAPIKDPLKLLKGSADVPGIHSVEGVGCAIDSLLLEIANRYPKKG